jgi:hypothetical protein
VLRRRSSTPPCGGGPSGTTLRRTLGSVLLYDFTVCAQAEGVGAVELAAHLRSTLESVPAYTWLEPAVALSAGMAMLSYSARTETPLDAAYARELAELILIGLDDRGVRVVPHSWTVLGPGL